MNLLATHDCPALAQFANQGCVFIQPQDVFTFRQQRLQQGNGQPAPDDEMVKVRNDMAAWQNAESALLAQAKMYASQAGTRR